MLAHLPLLNSVNILGYQFPVTTIGAFLNILFFVVIALLGAKKLKLNFSASVLMVLLSFVISNIISRIFFIISRIYLHHDFAYQGKVFYFYTNQKISFGFILAIFLAVLIGVYIYDLRKEVGRYFDIFSIAYLSLFFGRVGGALTRYHPGKITDSFWGSYYLGHYRHEPSLYEAASLLLIFIIALFVRKKIKIAGLLALIVLAWVSLSRVITDFFRNDDLLLANFNKANAFETANYHFKNGLTFNQLVYFLVFISSAILIYFLYRKHKDNIVQT